MLMRISILLVCAIIGSCVTEWGYAEAPIDFREAYRKTQGAIVKIEVKVSGAGDVEDEQKDPTAIVYAPVVQNGLTFWMKSHVPQESKFCGVLIDDKGTILTTLLNDQATEFAVTDHQGKSYTAKLLSYDAATRCALLKIQEGSEFHSLSFAAPGFVEPGLPVALIWNGDSSKVKLVTGVVQTQTYWSSSVNVPVVEVSSVVQPIASGGAVVNSEGALCGILSRAMFEQFEGAGYFIPIDSLQPLIRANANKTAARLERGGLGVILGEHASVKEVRSESAAEKGGLKAGDVIKKVNGASISEAADIQLALSSFRAGETVVVDFQREEEIRSVEITLDVIPMQPIAKSMDNLMPWNSLNTLPPGSLSWPDITSRMPMVLTPDPVTAPLPPGQKPLPVAPRPSPPPSTMNKPVPSLPPVPAAPNLANPNGRVLVQPPHLQVERSDLEESIRQLREDINQLSEELKKQRK